MDSVVAAVLVVCALTMTAATLLNYRDRSRVDIPDASGPTPTPVEEAVKYSAVGHTRGNHLAPVTIVVFSDFECPYCGAFASNTIPHLDSVFGDSIQIVFRHMPLPGHRLAYPVARAAECAGSQGRFWAFHDTVFRHQDSLGILSLSQFAVRAGVPRIGQFEECIAVSRPVEAVERDLEASRELGLKGTPSLLVGRMLLQGVPPTDVLDSLVRVAALASVQPPPRT